MASARSFARARMARGGLTASAIPHPTSPPISRRPRHGREGAAEAAAVPLAPRSLLVRGLDGRVSLTPQTAGWNYVSFSATWIPKGGRFVVEAEDSEVCVVVIAGRCSVRVGEVSW